MDTRNQELLIELPLLLNSSLSTKEVLSRALQQIRDAFAAEAATIFLKEEGANELTFWVLAGDTAGSLGGKKMPADRGVVGWVIQNREPALVPDAHADSRFFAVIEEESKFKTRDMVCAPLLGRGDKILGAIQILNRTVDGPFSEDDLAGLTRVAPVIALALENARLFETLEARTRQLEALDRRKDEIMSLIGHEFQTPLNVILTSSELLAGGVLKDPAAIQKLADTLTKGIMRLSKAVANVRTVSVLSSGAIQLHREPIALAEVFETLRKYFDPIVARRSQTLTCDTAAGLDAVSADRTLLLLLLFNLISNAVRFTPDGGRITVAARPEAGLAVIEVKDTGIGIEPSQQEAVFARFYEVTNILQHSSGDYEFRSSGLGLGLAAASAIAAAHGAKLELTSIPAAGSTFRLRLATA